LAAGEEHRLQMERSFPRVGVLHPDHLRVTPEQFAAATQAGLAVVGWALLLSCVSVTFYI
jgi:hypothetical protein